MKSTSKLIISVSMFLALIASAYAAVDSKLMFAVATREDKRQVEALLAQGVADINAKDEFGNTILHWAVKYGRQDIAKLLLAKGADVNGDTKNGRTPLHYAASAGHKDIAELLLANGADVNAKNVKGDGWTPLHDAASAGHKDIAELLLVKGADVNAKDSIGRTPLDSIAKNNGKKDIVELLKEHQAKQARLLEGNIKSNPRAALVQLTARLKDSLPAFDSNFVIKGEYRPELVPAQLNPADDSTRRLIIKLASGLKPAPAIPEEARKHFVEGTAIVKAAKNPAQQALAAQSFTEALKVAPWWGDAYYNLGVTQELAEKYDEAEKAFNFYLLSNPNATEKREVQDRIYALSAKRKLLGAK